MSENDEKTFFTGTFFLEIVLMDSLKTVLKNSPEVF